MKFKIYYWSKSVSLNTSSEYAYDEYHNGIKPIS